MNLLGQVLETAGVIILTGIAFILVGKLMGRGYIKKNQFDSVPGEFPQYFGQMAVLIGIALAVLISPLSAISDHNNKQIASQKDKDPFQRYILNKRTNVFPTPYQKVYNDNGKVLGKVDTTTANTVIWVDNHEQKQETKIR